VAGSEHETAAVDDEGLAGDVARQVAREEHCDRADVGLGITDVAQRRAVEQQAVAGPMQFTRMFLAAYSSAATLVSPSSACFAAT